MADHDLSRYSTMVSHVLTSDEINKVDIDFSHVICVIFPYRLRML